SQRSGSLVERARRGLRLGSFRRRNVPSTNSVRTSIAVSIAMKSLHRRARQYRLPLLRSALQEVARFSRPYRKAREEEAARLIGASCEVQEVSGGKVHEELSSCFGGLHFVRRHNRMRTESRRVCRQ